MNFILWLLFLIIWVVMYAPFNGWDTAPYSVIGYVGGSLVAYVIGKGYSKG